MKKRRMITTFIFGFFLCILGSTPTMAKELYVFTKEAITAYSDVYGSQIKGKVPSYIGAKVEEKKDNYCLLSYEKKNKKQSAWISRSDYRELCLEYDGSKIPLVEPGIYLMGGQKVSITDAKDGKYRIQVLDSKKYIGASGSKNHAAVVLKESKESEDCLWEFKRENYGLLIQHKKTGLYMKLDQSALIMVKREDAILNTWELIRQENLKKQTKKNYRNFLQYDGRWGAKQYGKSTPMAQAGCGVLVVVNAIYSLNGQFLDPMEAARYACEKEYRVEYNGTDEEFLRAFVKEYGNKFGIAYQQETSSLPTIKKTLQAGGVVAAHVPGHYVCIVAYDDKKDRYLVLDSHPLPKRQTSPFGDWVSASTLIDGRLEISSAYSYQKLEKSNQKWNPKNQDRGIFSDLLFNFHPNKKNVFGWLMS